MTKDFDRSTYRKLLKFGLRAKSNYDLKTSRPSKNMLLKVILKPTLSENLIIFSHKKHNMKPIYNHPEFLYISK